MVPTDTKPAILLLGPFPPPLGGQAILLRTILDSRLASRFELVPCNIAHCNPGPMRRSLLTLRFLARFLATLMLRRQIRVLHIHSSAGIALLEKGVYILAGKLLGKRIILHLHGGRLAPSWNSAGALKRRLIKGLLDRCDLMVLLSQSGARFVAREIAPKAELVVLPNAVETGPSVTGSEGACHLSDLPGRRRGTGTCGASPLAEAPGAPVATGTPEARSLPDRRMPGDTAVTFLYVGHLKPEKGLLELLEAFRLCQPHAEMRLRLMGEGDTAANERLVRAAYAEAALEGVSFLGVLSGEAKWREFGKADVFVLPSHSEDMPITILEAMACGLPVLSTLVGAIPEVIEQGVNGCLVPPRDPGALAEAMRLLANNPRLRETQGEANRLKAERDYSLHHYLQSLEGLYLSLVAPPPLTGGGGGVGEVAGLQEGATFPHHPSPSSKGRGGVLALSAVFIFVLVTVMSPCGGSPLQAAENLALGARYTLEPKPNYQLTRDPSDSVKLTDGSFARGHFWKDREATLGWQQHGTVRIRLELVRPAGGQAAAEPVPRQLGSVCVNSARGSKAGVSFPERIDLFASRDGENYRYLGDLMAGLDHGEGGYLVRKFCAEVPATEASSLELFLQPKGNYAFLDEVEVRGVRSSLTPAPLPEGEGKAIVGEGKVIEGVWRRTEGEGIGTVASRSQLPLSLRERAGVREVSPRPSAKAFDQAPDSTFPLTRPELPFYQRQLAHAALERQALLKLAQQLLADSPAAGAKQRALRKELEQIIADARKPHPHQPSLKLRLTGPGPPQPAPSLRLTSLEGEGVKRAVGLGRNGGKAAELLRVGFEGEGEKATDALRDRLYAWHARYLAASYSERLILWRKDPWAAFTSLDSPRQASSRPGALRFDLVPGGVSSDAVILTNNSGMPQSYRIVARPATAAGTLPQLRLREAVPVLLADGSYRADPLVELEQGRLSLKAGESKQLWLTASAAETPAGRFGALLEVIPDSGSRQALRLPLELVVWQAEFPAHPALKVNAWSYLNWRPIEKIPQQAVADLEGHHVNVVVLHPDQIPWPRAAAGRAKNGSTFSLALDYREFDRVLRLHGKAERYLFFLNFKDPRLRALKNDLDFMSGPWRSLFEAWIRDWSRHLDQLGIPKSRYAFYPVDEPQNGTEAAHLREVARLIKSIDPGLQLYTTLDDPDRLGSGELAALLELVDLFQVSQSALSQGKLSRLKGAKNLWLYESDGGKKLDPLRGYRLQPWRAYRAGATGVGFWAYADTGAAGSAWNDLDGNRPDFSVIYEGSGDIVSSKRWEAWREGVEDYRLLAEAGRRLKPGRQREEFAERLRRVLEGSLDYPFFEGTRRFLLKAATGQAL